MRQAHGGYAFLVLHHMVVRVWCLCSLTIESGLDERGSPRPPRHAIDGLWHALAETNTMAKLNASTHWVVSSAHNQHWSPDVIYSAKRDAETEANRLSANGTQCWVETLQDRTFKIKL